MCTRLTFAAAIVAFACAPANAVDIIFVGPGSNIYHDENANGEWDYVYVEAIGDTDYDYVGVTWQRLDPVSGNWETFGSQVMTKHQLNNTGAIKYFVAGFGGSTAHQDSYTVRVRMWHPDPPHVLLETRRT